MKKGLKKTTRETQMDLVKEARPRCLSTARGDTYPVVIAEKKTGNAFVRLREALRSGKGGFKETPGVRKGPKETTWRSGLYECKKP